MADQDRADAPGTPAEVGVEPFRNISMLRNHWSRPASPRAYYWYLTFADAPELHALAAKCQQAIAFPYYDPIPPESLHLTLDRVAFEDGITPTELNATASAAQRACQAIPHFPITVGPLGGTLGAVGFTLSPARPVRDLRDALRAATLSICPAAPVTPYETAPHITIAYSNSDGVPAAEAIRAVEKLNASAARAQTSVREATLVLLERRRRSYAWGIVARVPLAGTNHQPSSGGLLSARDYRSHLQGFRTVPLTCVTDSDRHARTLVLTEQHARILAPEWLASVQLLPDER